LKWENLTKIGKDTVGFFMNRSQEFGWTQGAQNMVLKFGSDEKKCPGPWDACLFK
jgi:hypothetical protein